MNYNEQEFKLTMDKITIICGDKIRYNIERWLKSLQNNNNKMDLFITRVVVLSYCNALRDAHLISCETYNTIRQMAIKGSELNDS